jgi:hypothetical protein
MTGIKRIFLVPLHERLDIGQRNKTHFMADLRELTAPVMRASARLKRYDTAWLFREKVEQLGSADLLAEKYAPALISTRRAKKCLRSNPRLDDPITTFQPIMLMVDGPETGH